MRYRVLLSFLLVACGGSNGSSGADTRRELLTEVADGVVIPTYTEFAAATPQLLSAVTSLCATPEQAGLDAAREAWADARAAFKRTEGFAIGPVDTLRLDDFIDFWPVRVSDVEEELESSDFDLSRVSGLGATRRGLPVMEYLLWQELSRFQAEANLCQYLSALTQVLVDDSEALLASWATSPGGFRDELVLAGEGSETYTSLAMPVSDLANALFLAIEEVEGIRFAKPLGKRDGDVPQPNAVESRFSDRSVEDALDTLTGIERTYRGGLDGASPNSFSTFVAAANSELAAEVDAQFVACRQSLLDIPAPLSEVVVGDAQPAEDAFECLKELLRLFKSDIAVILGVIPRFGDVDGD